ncbi:MAG: sensor histidine kinase [Alphaproteobacteria bacterium]|nr:sensor histidine kinase [Alphaproteobacteria bacterium]
MLIVNELVLNALRHAFSQAASGVILVTLHRTDGVLYVSVADNGAGLPVGYDTKNGFGMRLVRMMASKIGATLEIESSGGARFTLIAPGA